MRRFLRMRTVHLLMACGFALLAHAAALIGPGSMTHSTDSGQVYIKLKFAPFTPSRDPSQATTIAPAYIRRSLRSPRVTASMPRPVRNGIATVATIANAARTSESEAIAATPPVSLCSDVAPVAINKE